jgi:hypothetical protein
MLIDNKFIYLSLPRCASTAFHYSCILSEFEIKTYTNQWIPFNNDVDFKSIDKLNLMNHIYHAHESIIDLQSKFGTDYPVIAVNRNRHERFYSLYKHILFDLKRTGYNKIYDVFSKLTLNELFFFTKNDIINKKQRWDTICGYLIDLKLIDKKVDIVNWEQTTFGYAINMIDILLTPTSYWTNNDSNIIWFDFTKMNELESWVSKKLNKPFKLESANSSKHIKCDVVLDDMFIKKYNNIYDYYDLPKSTKTLI